MNVDVLVCPHHGALDCQRRRGVGPSQQGEVLIIVIGQNDQLKCCQRHDLSPLTHPQEFDGVILPDIHPYITLFLQPRQILHMK